MKHIEKYTTDIFSRKISFSKLIFWRRRNVAHLEYLINSGFIASPNW